MDNTNKQAVLTAIWNNPAPAMGGQWRQTNSGRRWEYITGSQWSQRGAVSLLQTQTGDIKVFFNHGTGRTSENPGILDYLAGEFGTGNFWETLQAAAKLYNIDLKFTDEQRAAIRRGELARAVAASFVEALRLNPQGATAKYITQTRRLSLDGVHFGELTADSLKRAKDSLQARGKRWNAADLEALGLTEARARAGYCCVLPYYSNGIITGFLLRNLNPSKQPKALKNEGMGRPGYCDRLEPGKPAVVVEGELDAIRLIQQGVKNVIAMGGPKAGAEIGRLLAARGISEIVYIPDVETDETGRRKPSNLKLTADAIQAFQSLEVEGEPVIKSLLVLDLPTPSGANAKTDADSYGADNPGTLPGMIEFEPVEAWAWEVEQLRNQANQMKQAGRRPDAFIQGEIMDIYTRNRSPFAREKMRQYVGNCGELAAYGVTPQALADIDEWEKGRKYQNVVKQAAADLNKAVQEQANPETVGAIVRRLIDAQGANTRGDWVKQFEQDFNDDLEAIRNQPATLKTCWELGNVKRTDNPQPGGKYYKKIPYERIEFYPSDITVFCAATSHGKTAVLFAAAFDLVKQDIQAGTDNKKYLFVSCEESKRQLTERALNVFLPIPPVATDENGEVKPGGVGYIPQTRKKAIKAAITGAEAPAPYSNTPGLFEALKREINAGVEVYRRDIWPRLKFIHTEAAIESICSNILYTVEQCRARGVEVGAVFVDYVQLLTADAPNYSRHDELKDIIKALHDCAARVELPVIMAAQFNRETLKPGNAGGGTGLDNITVANVGEAADIERAAHDLYLVWQTDKTPLQWYTTKGATSEEPTLDGGKIAGGIRSHRIFTRPPLGGMAQERQLKTGYLYIEQLKARDGLTGGWGLLPFDGERGTVGANDWDKMAE